MAQRISNRVHHHRQDEHPPTIRKVRADTVPFGTDVSRNGRTVWIALDGEKVIAVAATSAEVRVKYREALRREQQQYLKC